jgi:hypothetical protein
VIPIGNVKIVTVDVERGKKYIQITDCGLEEDDGLLAVDSPQEVGIDRRLHRARAQQSSCA